PHAHTHTPSLHNALPIYLRQISLVLLVLVTKAYPERLGEVGGDHHRRHGNPLRRIQDRHRHDAAPIAVALVEIPLLLHGGGKAQDRKSTRLNSSHEWGSY